MSCRAYLALLAFVVAAAVPVLAASPVEAQTCVVNPETIQCEVGTGVGGGSRPGTDPSEGGTPDGSGSGTGNSGPQEPRDIRPVETQCTWETIGGPRADAIRNDMSNVPADALIQIPVGCTSADLGGADPNNEARWVPPGGEAPPRPRDPADVAAGVFAQVNDLMVAPAVTTDPPVGTPSIISLPVFVQVTNWQGPQSVGTCDGPVCVELTATPTLSFEPGEPGAAPVVCTPPGTRYDPAGGDPVDQALAPGACAHVYTERTGVAGRPDAWPAQVVVTWDVQWTSTINGAAGPSGGFDPMSLSTGVPRVVDEVQTIVVDGSSS